MSTDHRPSVDQLLTDTSVKYRPTIDQLSAKCRRSVGEMLAKCRWTKSYIGRDTSGKTIDRVSTKGRPTIDRLSTAMSTDCRPSVDRLSTDYRPSIDRLSTECRPLYRPMSRSTLPTVNKIRVKPTKCTRNYVPLVNVTLSKKKQNVFTQNKKFVLSLLQHRPQQMDTDTMYMYQWRVVPRVCMG